MRISVPFFLYIIIYILLQRNKHKKSIDVLVSMDPYFLLFTFQNQVCIKERASFALISYLFQSVTHIFSATFFLTKINVLVLHFYSYWILLYIVRCYIFSLMLFLIFLLLLLYNQGLHRS